MSPITIAAFVALVLLLVLVGLFWRKTYRQLLASEHELNVTKDQLGLVTEQRNMFRRHSTAAAGALPYLERSTDSFYGTLLKSSRGNETMANAKLRMFEVERNARLDALRSLLERDLGVEAVNKL